MKKIDDEKKREVSYSEDNHIDVKNIFLEAIYPDGIKSADIKVMRFVMSQCKLGDKEFFEYEFNATDIAEFLNLDRHNLYREAVKMTEERLFNCNLKLGTKEKHELIHLFKKCKYDNGTFIMRMDDEASEYFLGLRGNFTEIPIAPILAMRNINSIRIYELMCGKFMSHYPYSNNATSINVTLEELRRVTKTEDKKSYDQAGHVKDRILKPAIQEIEKAAEWKINIKNIKRSRQVIGFTLEVWDANGYALIEECKREGKLPPQPKYWDEFKKPDKKPDKRPKKVPDKMLEEKPDEIPWQMSLFDLFPMD